MKFLFVLILFCGPVLGQSVDDLQRKYGRPISETFELRKGIYVTANSNQAGNVCELTISPHLASETLNYPGTRTMTPDEVTSIIDELVPFNIRGKATISGFVNVTCLPLNNCAGATENYERVSIFRNGESHKVRYVDIKFVRPDCPR